MTNKLAAFKRTVVGSVALTFLYGSACLSASAQTIPAEYDQLIKNRTGVTVFGNDGFGDRIDVASGGLEIIQTDVDIPGNNALPVRIARRFTPGNKYAGGHFGVWTLDIPYAHGTFSDFGENESINPKGWTVDGTGANVYKRCSGFSAPRTILFQSSEFQADEYWHGNFFHLPGSGDEEMVHPGSPYPTDGNTYYAKTKGGAVARCVSLAATSTGQGEGFEVVTPDGTIYTLNHMVSRTEKTISKPAGTTPSLVGGNAASGNNGNGNGNGGNNGNGGSNGNGNGGEPDPTIANNFTLTRVEVYLYPTKVTDRFGNTVTYTWSSNNPWQLLSISSNDQRTITLTYPDSTSNQVSSVSDGTHTWTYSGTSSAYTITRPDGSTWVSNLTDLFDYQLSPLATGNGCYGGAPTYTGTPVTGSITSPSGATVVYTMNAALMGRSWVPHQCVVDDNGSNLYAVEPRYYYNFAITSKKITGPGLPTAGLTWSYAYGPPNGCWSSGDPSYDCTGSSPTTRTVTVTNPEGEVTRHSINNKYGKEEGLEVKAEYGWNGTTALRTVDTTYADADAAPYAAFTGGSPRQRGDAWTAGKLHPVRKTLTTQQGRTFTWEVVAGCNGYPYCFDGYGRPTKVVKSSAP